MQHLLNNYNTVKMERSLTTQDPKQYAYLSIDQLRKTLNPRMTLDNTSMNEFFNIKFDSQSPLRQKTGQKDFTKLIESNHQKKSQQPSSILNKFKSSQQRRLYFSMNPRTKKMNTEKMLQSITKIIKKEQQTKKSSKEANLIRKPLKIFSSDIGSSTSSNQKTNISISQLNNCSEKYCHDKNRRLMFQQMLKKCEKLKEIYKYENQLINMRHFKGSHLGLRFHTEPLGSFSVDHSGQQPFSFPKKINQKKMIKYMLTNHNQNQQQIDHSAKKSLDIRKYKNESVLKQRLKYFIKKSQMKKQQPNMETLRKDKVSQKRRHLKANQGLNLQKIAVGPWAQDEEAFDIQFR